MRFTAFLLTLLLCAPAFATEPVIDPGPMPDPSAVEVVPVPRPPAPPPLTPAVRARVAAEAAKPRVTGAWTRPAAMGGNAAIYASFTGGDADDRLLGISTAWADKAALHETVVDAQGVVRMLPALAGFSLPARKLVIFAPGGRHVMLTGLTRALQARQTFPVIFNFEKAGAVRVMVEVRAAPAMPMAMPPADEHAGHQ